MTGQENTSTGLKVSMPPKFSGKRSELKEFLLKLDIYLEVNENDFQEEVRKVLFASSFLQGEAFAWFERYVRDYLDNGDRASRPTLEIFNDCDTFKQEMVNLFGETNEARKAVIALENLKQDGSMIRYAARFQGLAAKAG